MFVIYSVLKKSAWQYLSLLTCRQLITVPVGIVQSPVCGSWNSWCSGLWAQDYQTCFLSQNSFKKKIPTPYFFHEFVCYLWAQMEPLQSSGWDCSKLRSLGGNNQLIPEQPSQHHYKISGSYIDSAVTLCLHSRWVCRMLHQLYSESSELKTLQKRLWLRCQLPLCVPEKWRM